MENRDWLFIEDDHIHNFRSSGVLIMDNKLLIQCGANDSVYALPGGHVAFGETSAETIVREYKEETGADIEAGRLIWVDESFWKWGSRHAHTITFYHILALKDKSQIPLFGEFSSLKTNDSSLIFKWIELDELENIEIYPTFIKEKASNISDGIEHFIYRE